MEDNKKMNQVAQHQCAVCGCTDNDCSKCIEKTGHPCHWFNNSLCSACVPSFGRL